jgi:hypothetical protein
MTPAQLAEIRDGDLVVSPSESTASAVRQEFDRRGLRVEVVVWPIGKLDETLIMNSPGRRIHVTPAYRESYIRDQMNQLEEWFDDLAKGFA